MQVLATERSVERNWYVLFYNLPSIESELPLGDGLTLRRLAAPLSVFDLASAGAQGFRPWAALEPLAPACTSEIESAADSSNEPGYDPLNRVWLASALLRLRGFGDHLGVACTSYSWQIVAGFQERTKTEQLNDLRARGREAIENPVTKLPEFDGQLLDYHLKFLADPSARSDPVTKKDAEWVRGSGGTFYARLRRYFRQAGVDAPGIHVLRHTASKLRRDAGESIEAVWRSSTTRRWR